MKNLKDINCFILTLIDYAHYLAKNMIYYPKDIIY